MVVGVRVGGDEDEPEEGEWDEERKPTYVKTTGELESALLQYKLYTCILYQGRSGDCI
jgi:hypothetical protein